MNTDDIGDRGQCLFHLLITQLCHGRNDPYFRPHFLGDKFPTVDYLVELVRFESYFFYVQVKTTTLGVTKSKRQPSLNVAVSQRNINRMVASPIPPYVVGVDEPNARAFLCSVNEPRAAFTSLATKYPLNSDNMKLLWQEVHDFWSKRDMILKGSHFV